MVDDDEAVRESLERLMQSVGLAVEAYPHAQAFLEGYDRSRPGCVLLDIRMPGMSGLDLQDRLLAEGMRIPVIIISAHGNVEKAVRAMKAGAVDFIKKPYKGPLLLDRIRSALAADVRTRHAEAERVDVAARMAKLTRREREVMSMLATGKAPKQIAFELGLSRKTIDVHRGHIMTKMRVDSLVELSHMVQTQQEPRPSGSP
ncbi:MAG: response regulator transcription factor [bacterium]|nr:response regulator transcription factor [bacterium]